MPFKIKRVYDPPAADDGWRVLVDRLWPRGLTKQAAAVDLWLREVAPSAELRTWYGHDRARWEEFRQRYGAELEGKAALLAPLRAAAQGQPVTLLFGAADTECNNAVALREYLGEH
jgi:uncharacterized protein YeaO (DUF488 family)